jgi:hypothetical protein
MRRRDVLLVAGAVAGLSLVPRAAQEAWNRVATTYYPPTDSLNESQLALITALADTIIPRTDTPGATDVGVPAWINFMAAEYFTSAERVMFLRGLDEIEMLAIDTFGAPLAMSATKDRERVIAILERPNAYERFVDRLEDSHRFSRMITNFLHWSVVERLMIPFAERARAYSRLKTLIVHGYFTSERVQKDVLRAVIIPGNFDGSAPMPHRHEMGGA